MITSKPRLHDDTETYSVLHCTTTMAYYSVTFLPSLNCITFEHTTQRLLATKMYSHIGLEINQTIRWQTLETYHIYEGKSGKLILNKNAWNAQGPLCVVRVLWVVLEFLYSKLGFTHIKYIWAYNKILLATKMYWETDWIMINLFTSWEE